MSVLPLPDYRPYNLRYRGKAPTRPTSEIADSRIGVGFETLDRLLFTPERVYPHLAKLGAKWARCQTGWCRCERERGHYDFTWLDDVADSLLAAGVKPWFSLSFGNRLYLPQAPHESAVGYSPVYDPIAREAWLRYVGRMVKHFRERVKHWEIWNEPNTVSFWRNGSPDGADYTELVRITAQEIRRLQPDAKIIGGAVSGAALGFVAECVRHGLTRWIDAFSFHPYTQFPELNYESYLRSLREILDAPSIELWQGECGCPSRADGHSADFPCEEVSELLQAKWLCRRILTDLHAGLDHTQYFVAVDFGLENPYMQGSGTPCKPIFMGLLDGFRYEPKPAFRALQTLCNFFDDQTQPATQYCTEDFCNQTGPASFNPRARCLSFRRKGIPLIAYYDAGERPTNCYANQPVKIVCDIRPGYEFRRLVLIEPVSGDCYDILNAHLFLPKEQECRPLPPQADNTAGWYVFDQIPLSDTPFLLTDQALLDELQTHTSGVSRNSSVAPGA